MAARADQLSILVPPSPEHVASARVFVGAVGRHFGCSEETIEDLRIAATEACSQALRESAEQPIELRAWLDDDHLRLEIEPSGRLDDGTQADEDLGVDERRALIQSLFPDARFEERDGRPVLVISVEIHDE